MKIIGIAAIDLNRSLGQSGMLPWVCPDDIQFFKEQTTGHAVCMGRKTYEGLPFRPLKNRLNVVLSRKKDNISYRHSNLDFCSTLSEAIDICKLNYSKFFICGGASVYGTALDSGVMDRFFLTVIKNVYPADCHLPIFPSGWELLRKIKETQDYMVLDFVNYKKT
jgi:dihydrofolate reductase